MTDEELVSKVVLIADVCGIPKATLASLVGVHRATLYKWLNGERKPHDSQKRRLGYLSNLFIRAYNDKAFPLKRRGRKATRRIAEEVRQVLRRYS